MRTPATNLLALLLMVAAADGCDGGPIGTGIVASVSGNVESVTGAAAGTLDAARSDGVRGFAPGAVTVSIEGVPGATSPVDEAGNFAIVGEFSGRVALRFETPAWSVRRKVEVPSGAIVVLSDIVLTPDGIWADSGRDVGFLGKVRLVDCAAGRIDVEDVDGPRRAPIGVILDGDTAVTGDDGSPADCASIAPGARVVVEGRFDAETGDGETLIAQSIAISDRRPGKAEVLNGVRFAGFLDSVNCPGGVLAVSDEEQRSHVRIDAATELRGSDGRRIDCRELILGDRLHGAGRLRVDDPGTIAATDLVADESKAGKVDVRLTGRIDAVDCATGRMVLDDRGTPSTVQLLADTVLEPRVACEAIPLGGWARGRGRLDRARPTHAIPARRLSLWKPGAPD